MSNSAPLIFVPLLNRTDTDIGREVAAVFAVAVDLVLVRVAAGLVVRDVPWLAVVRAVVRAVARGVALAVARGVARGIAFAGAACCAARGDTTRKRTIIDNHFDVSDNDIAALLSC
ncbi:MAG: hypothetical protein OES79_05985 [Planctomycetota bacterium]|nr:hypothetical protein [Planctomycetota bacterium]